MKAFHSGQEAKEFLIAKIVAEAARQYRLSEVERKMLYFTETGWALPDIMNVSEDFDRDYDQDEYEQKIAKLVARADKETHRPMAHKSRFRMIREVILPSAGFSPNHPTFQNSPIPTSLGY